MKPTGTEARVCEDIADRQAKGIAKYGTTVEGNPLGLLQWYKHHYEELLDAAVYVKRIIGVMEGVKAPVEMSFSPEDFGLNFSKQSAAVATLERMNYEWRGGELWAPPIGKAPAWINEAEKCCSTTLEDGSVLTAYAMPIKGVFEFWWAVCMPKATQAEAWKEWCALHSKEPAEVDPHHDLRKTWKPGQVWQGRSRSEGPDAEWFTVDCPIWTPAWEYRRHPEDKHPESKEAPWYPDDSGEWVECDGCMSMPEALDDTTVVEYLRFYERESKSYKKVIDIASDCDWGLRPNSMDRVVAYKVFK